MTSMKIMPVTLQGVLVSNLDGQFTALPQKPLPVKQNALRANVALEFILRGVAANTRLLGTFGRREDGASTPAKPVRASLTDLGPLRILATVAKAAYSLGLVGN